jgi:predicted Zn-dependent peptidase
MNAPGRHPAPTRAENVRTSTLPNGIRVVTEAMPHLATASVGVWIGAGTRHELGPEQGLAHLLEHMAFKGTRRRSALAIAEEVEAVGGDLNAETSAERTAYYARVLGEDVPLALDILSDILAEPAFDRGELKREKGVVLQEIGACEDTPD